MVEARQARAADGVRLHLDRHPAAGVPWASVLLLHGMMADRRSMDRPAGRGLATTLAGHGLEVFNADFRGHGLSGDRGPWTYEDLVRSDLPALVQAARIPDRPVWVVGLSLGGHVGLAAVAEGRVAVDGLVLLSANIWRPAYEPSPWRRLRKTAELGAMRAIARAVGRFPARRLRIGPADEAVPYVEDLAGFWFGDRWAGRTGVDWARCLAGVRVPVLSLVGRGDRHLAHPASARAWLGPVPGHRFAVVGRGDLGLGHDPDHVGLGADPRCRPVWDWIARWIRAHRPR